MDERLISTPTSLERLGVNTFNRLCEDASKPNIEIFKPNHFYGHANTLKKYAHYPLKKPLKAVIQHGYNFLDENFIFGGEMEADAPVFFPPNRERADLYHEASGGKPAIPIGAPFLYAQKLLDQHPELATSPNQQGTIVFPVHSTRVIQASFNHQGYAEQLNNLPQAFKPISVCLYWRDYQNGSHIPYQEKGFEILTAGHMMNSDFIERVYLNCRPFKFACSNEYGSSMFYAIASGCHFFYLPSGPISYTANDPQKAVLQGLSKVQQKNFESLFTYPQMASLTQQKHFALQNLGADFLKTPQELYELFQWAAWKDWTYCTPIARRNKAPMPVWFLRIPPYWRRHKLIQKLAKTLKVR
jgi:hypothetical protein